jgi:ubiquinone biosynthesis protein COQ4
MDRIKQGAVVARGVWACADLILHPDRFERVYEITSALASFSTQDLERMRVLFETQPVGATALRERRRLAPDLQQLSKLPAGSLGRTYAEHMIRNNISASVLPETGDRVVRPRHPFGAELQFIRAHIYDTHDIWHVVTGFGTDIAGELGLQGFGAAQTPYSLPFVLLGLGCLHTAFKGIDDSARRMDAVRSGWLIGKRASPFFGVRWDEHWARPLTQVRRELQVEPYGGAAAQAHIAA